MLELEPGTISTPKLHGYMLSVIGPRPIAFASTIDKAGNPNLAPFSFFNVFSANPPILVFSPARGGRDNKTKHTHENIKEVPEVVINIVNYKMVQQTSLASTAYEKGVNEFIKAGFTPIKSDKVKPFRVKESPAQIECKVREVIELGNEGGAGNLIICEVVKMHISEDVLNAEGRVDQKKIDLVGRMGGNWYCHANENALFEVKKPIANLGIGVDNIPVHIRSSKYLTGNDLGMLGNIESLPDKNEIQAFKTQQLNTIFSDSESNADIEKTLHQKAHQYLEDGLVIEAWKTLLSKEA